MAWLAVRLLLMSSPFFLPVSLNNIVVLHLVVPSAVSSVGLCWRLQTAHYFSLSVWRTSLTSHWIICGLQKCFDPLRPSPSIQSYHLSLISCWLSFDRRTGWPWMCQHMVPSVWVISLASYWVTKICHNLFVQVPWHGELDLEFQFFCYKIWGTQYLGELWWYY